MLDRNMIEQVRVALNEAENSQASELEERLNICKILIGTYELSRADKDSFQSFSSDDFVDFYNSWFYRAPDKVVPKGSGIIFALSEILEGLDRFRKEKNISQEYADKVKATLDDKRSQLEAWEAIKSEINNNNLELASLTDELSQLESDIKELHKLKVRISEHAALVNEKKAELSDENPSELKAELERLKEELTDKEMTLETAIKIARLFYEAELFRNINLDLLCEYVEDGLICEEINKMNRAKTDDLNKLKGYESQIESIFRNYRDLLKGIILEQ